MTSSPQTESSRLLLQKEYIAAFVPYGLVPILLPRGQDVGDVISGLDGGFMARANECFSGLVPQEELSTLPAIDVTWNAAAQIALGVEAIAAGEAQGRAEDRVQVRFEKVSSRTASLTHLRQHVRSRVLPEVARLLAADAVEFLRAPDWLLIGEVLTAVTVVRVSRSRSAGGKASLGFLERLFGRAAKAEGGGDLTSASVATIVTETPLPIAFRPARVRVTNEIAGAFRGVSTAAFDANDEAHRKAFADWAARTVRPIGSGVLPTPPG
jgi:hypothetical protein